MKKALYMMKRAAFKRLAFSLAAMCIMLPFGSATAHAANGADIGQSGLISPELAQFVQIPATSSDSEAMQLASTDSDAIQLASAAFGVDGTELGDAELAEVNAGEYELLLDGFNVTISDNQAGMFSFDIAQSAFDNAQGIFTTLQTVNSAVDLTVVVNIFVDGS